MTHIIPLSHLSKMKITVWYGRMPDGRVEIYPIPTTAVQFIHNLFGHPLFPSNTKATDIIFPVEF